MGWHFALVQVRVDDGLTSSLVVAAIERYWLAKGARDARNPLRIPRGAKRRSGRLGYAVTRAERGWICVAESERQITTQLAPYLHRELGATTCRYGVEDTVDAADMTWFGDHGEEPLRRAQDVLERAAQFPYGGTYFDQILDWPAADRRGMTTIGLRVGDGERDAVDAPEQEIWALLERGDGVALQRALGAPHAAAALGRADLCAPAERAAIEALEIARLSPPLLVTIAARAAIAGAEELYERVMADLPVTEETARLVTYLPIEDVRSALALYERFAAAAPAYIGTIAVTRLSRAERPDLETLRAWDARTAAVADREPAMHHHWARIWANHGDLERAVDHAARALACGYDRRKLREPLPSGGVADELHKRLTTVPRYRALFRDAPPSAPAARRVEHPTFGTGVIVRETGDTLEIEFESVGRKALKRRFVREV